MIRAPRRSSWIARVLGVPGSASFRRFDPTVDAATAALADLRRRSCSELGAAATAARFDDLPASEISGHRLAIIAEAARRMLHVDLHPGQLLGACALIAGNAIEMDTGEGKTLTGAVAAAYHALGGRRVQVITVNDFLARRDAEWMRDVFAALGLDVGWIDQATPRERRAAIFARHIVYVPVSELGYDLLRDRFVTSPEDRVLPRFDVGIVDEADAVMIDEAMNPLVLAGTTHERLEDMTAATRAVSQLVPGRDFVVDEGGLTASFTDQGLDAVEAQLGGIDLFSGEHTRALTMVNLALHARAIVHRDVDYLVAASTIKLINPGRGRVEAVQRWPDGLQAAVESKEGLPISGQGVTMDTVTIQDLLLRYPLLAGMSGSILTVSEELLEFYGLGSGRIERHRPLARQDRPSAVFRTRAEALDALTEHVRELHAEARPVLVGTQSVAESEIVGSRLRAVGLTPRVLNAGNDEAEAQVVACAGEAGAVTVSTQMSGRGTDIVLGGADASEHDRVVALGGLAVVGLGHFPSRRLDAQLRGRSGRQGDPGSSVFISSIEDELVEMHTPDLLRTMDSRARGRLGPRQLRSLVSSAQRIAEGARLERHRATWSMTRAISMQREHVLTHRERVLSENAAFEHLARSAPDVVRAGTGLWGLIDLQETARRVALTTFDDLWSAHLMLLEEVRDGVHLRVLAGEDPVRVFHLFALEEFDGWLDRVYQEVARALERLTGGTSTLQAETMRPSATWTYMVSENPLGDPMHRAMRPARTEAPRP